MNINSKFNLNQKVWSISMTKKEHVHNCAVCKSKRFLITEGHKYTCPKCNGRGQIKTYDPAKHHVTKLLTIGRVEVQIVSLDSRKSKFANYGVFDPQITICVTKLV